MKPNIQIEGHFIRKLSCEQTQDIQWTDCSTWATNWSVTMQRMRRA